MKDSKYLSLTAFIVTFIIAHFIYKITGFNYNFSKGLNINFLIDLFLWAVIYFSAYCILSKFWNKKD